MFVERMKVLEYHQKFEVELITFPGSNTETSRKMTISLTFVCVSVCMCEKFGRRYLSSQWTDLNEIFGGCCIYAGIDNLP